MATAKQIAEEVVKLLKTEKTATKELTAFQKTEKLLFSLKMLKGSIDSKEKQLETLRNDPVLLQKKEMGSGVQVSRRYLSDLEKVEDMIERVEREIARLQSTVGMAESALKSIEDDKYFKIIELRYFDELTFGHISEKMGVAEKTVRRQRNRLISKLQAIMFSDDTISEIINH